MFHFPWFAPPTLCIQVGVPQLFAAVGFPIRTSPDQRLVGNSPKLFAATHVLHRLSAHRHPPHALSSLLTSISCSHAPPDGWLVRARDQGPGPRSSRRTRENLESAVSRRSLLTQQLNSTFVCTFQRTLRVRPQDSKTCGADRDRTDDIQLAKLALSQLSYGPAQRWSWYGGSGRT